MKEEIISPITKTNDVRIVAIIPVERVIELYKRKIRIDVQKYFNDVKQLTIYKCNKTNLRFFTPFSAAGDESFYVELDRVRPQHRTRWKWEHEQIINHITSGMKVLEIGCGWGTFLRKAKENGALVTGLELTKNVVESNLDLDLRAELIEQHAIDNVGMYDLVCSFQVVEHIVELNSFLKKSIECLKAGGKFVISVPNYDCYLFRKDFDHTLNLPPHHISLWSKSALINIAQIYGLSVEEVITQPVSEKEYGQYYEVFLRNTIKLSNNKIREKIYTWTLPVVKKLFFRFFPPKVYTCITVIYKKQ